MVVINNFVISIDLIRLRLVAHRSNLSIGCFCRVKLSEHNLLKIVFTTAIFELSQEVIHFFDIQQR